MNELLEWCRHERDEALKSIEFWSQPGRAIQIGSIGQNLQDVTESHVADLKKIVEDMDRIIAAEEADPA